MGIIASAVTAALVVVPATARASTILDPLHGYCSGTAQCKDNSVNSPTTNNPPTNFGFTSSPPNGSGDFLLEILIPNNDDPTPSTLTFSVSGTSSGTAHDVSTTAWSSGQLDSYVGISATPANGIGAFLPQTQVGDPGASGFYVYQVDLGSLTLNGTMSLNLTSQLLPAGAYIVGFLNEGTSANPDWFATANSGAIFEDVGCTTCGPPFNGPGPGPIPIIPEPATLSLFGTGLGLLVTQLRRKRRA